MKIRNKPDFWSGVMFVVLGLGFAIMATNYSMGTAARMGPGYFPFWLGLCMAVLGAFIGLGALAPKAQEAKIDKFDYSIAIVIIGSVALTGVFMDFLGVYISVFLLVFLSSFASHVFSWKVAAINGLCMTIFVWLAFIKGLGLIFPLWPSFLGN